MLLHLVLHFGLDLGELNQGLVSALVNERLLGVWYLGTCPGFKSLLDERFYSLHRLQNDEPAFHIQNLA